MIPILYEERGFLVCLKPPGLLSQSGPGDDLLQALSRQAGGSFLPVHRLDRGVGGVMAVARSKSAAAALSAAVAQRKFEKEYLCLVRGRPLEEAGTYRDLLLHDRQRNKSFVVDRIRGGVKEAELDYRCLASSGGLSLVHVRLRTGRTHQIRVQFASRGTPLAGDGKYGGGPGEIALWSYRLSFPHPETGRSLTFSHLPRGGLWEQFLLEALLSDPTSPHEGSYRP